MNAKNMKDLTDWGALKRMTEKDIEDAANSDPDAPLLTEAELSQFKPVSVYKNGIFGIH
jgi:hypothetical protein